MIGFIRAKGFELEKTYPGFFLLQAAAGGLFSGVAVLLYTWFQRDLSNLVFCPTRILALLDRARLCQPVGFTRGVHLHDLLRPGLLSFRAVSQLPLTSPFNSHRPMFVVELTANRAWTIPVWS